jgi:hypothetical protein
MAGEKAAKFTSLECRTFMTLIYCGYRVKLGFSKTGDTSAGRKQVPM